MCIDQVQTITFVIKHSNLYAKLTSAPVLNVSLSQLVTCTFDILLPCRTLYCTYPLESFVKAMYVKTVPFQKFVLCFYFCFT